MNYVVACYDKVDPATIFCGHNSASKELVQKLCDQFNGKNPDQHFYPMSVSERDQRFEMVEGGA